MQSQKKITHSQLGGELERVIYTHYACCGNRPLSKRYIEGKAAILQGAFNAHVSVSFPAGTRQTSQEVQYKVCASPNQAAASSHLN